MILPAWTYTDEVYLQNYEKIDEAVKALLRAASRFRQPVSISQALKMRAVPRELKIALISAACVAIERAIAAGWKPPCTDPTGVV